MTTKRPTLLGSLIAAALLMGCSGGDAATDARAIGPVPEPVGDVVLTIDGDVGRPNADASVRADLAGLEALGTVSATVREPFLDEDIDITRVPVISLLAAAGVDDDAMLVWTALDDYQVRFTASEVAAEDAILATRLDGHEIAIEDGGPIRIIFGDDGGDLGRDSNQWIWSIVRIEVG